MKLTTVRNKLSKKFTKYSDAEIKDIIETYEGLSNEFHKGCKSRKMGIFNKGHHNLMERRSS